MELFLFILKPDRGDRPIAQIAGLLRLWESVGMEQVRAWHRRHARKYDWEPEGRSAEAAVREQPLESEVYDEGARPNEDCILTVLCDLVKCFDQVQLKHVW